MLATRRILLNGIAVAPLGIPKIAWRDWHYLSGLRIRLRRRMRNGGRAAVLVNGKQMSERRAGRLAGTRGARAMAKLGFDASAVPRRARYFAFRGSKDERRKLRAGISHLIRPLSLPQITCERTDDAVQRA